MFIISNGIISFHFYFPFFTIAIIVNSTCSGANLDCFGRGKDHVSGVPEGAAMSSFQGIVSLLGESECFYGGSEYLRKGSREKWVFEWSSECSGGN